MDKLSELSKPVFEIEISDGYWLNCSISPLQPRDGAKFNGWPDGVNRLYSQEYVSALDKVAQYWIGESAGWKKRAEDAEKRIAELEAKLATPVRLPNKNDAEFWFDGVFQVAKFDRAVERAVSAAGFKFVGDE
ncbi:hypothetical protein ACCH91_000864 [Serratia marcescens]